MDDSLEDPLIKALPPASDYLTYLTIIEYNLTKERLPLLHNLLRDTALTTNIGWDLVHLLLPLLPESESCLEDVARLGNPREVILKVTEMLEEIARDDDDDQDKYQEADVDEDSASIDEVKDDRATFYSDDTVLRPPSSKASRHKAYFIHLLKMLEILHPRIKTKYPSRFLSTSLNAIIPVYTYLAPERDITTKIIQFVCSMAATCKPPLPPRSGNLVTQEAQIAAAAPDPEDENEALTAQESRSLKRLLQVFVIQINEIYGHACSVDYEATGFAWSARFQEEMHPEKTLPNKLTYNQQCGREEKAYERQRTWLKLYDTAFDLGLKREDLTNAIMKAALPDYQVLNKDFQSQISSEDILLPPSGSFILLCCLLAVYQFHALKAPHTNVSLFPDYAALVSYLIGHERPSYIGTEAPIVIDSIIFLGFTIFASNRAAPTTSEQLRKDRHYCAPAPPLEFPSDYESFHNLLQRLSLLSAQCPFPSLRYNAHLLTSQILHAHPDDAARLRFISDTLAHCPYENLKVSAIGWLKEEILLADRQRPSSPVTKEPAAPQRIFLQKDLLKQAGIASALLPSLPPDWTTQQGQQSLSQRIQIILPLSSLLLASLNFWIFLLASPVLRERYGILAIAEETRFKERYLLPLTQLMMMMMMMDDEQKDVRKEDGYDYDDNEEREMVDDEKGTTNLLGTVAEMVMDRLEQAKRKD